MGKDPAFPWYASDFVVDTIQWDRAMQGLHCYLLSVSWTNRGLTADPTGIPTGLQPGDVEIWNRIKHKWQLKDGTFFSAKQEEIREKRKKFISSQSEKGKASAKKRGSTLVDHSVTLPVQPIEKENEYEIENEWIRWGKQIVDGTDIYWDQMKGRKIATEEMAEFISVATRNNWKITEQHKFRVTLNGWTSYKKSVTNGKNPGKF